MKTTSTLAFLAMAGTAFAAPGNGNSAEAIPALPLGALSAFPTVVQTGTNPTLTWSILYPSTVGDVATITPPGTVGLSKPIFVSVQPVGVGVTGSDSGQDKSDIHAEARISINDSAYDQLFYGSEGDVDPAYSFFIKKLHTGNTINIGGRFVENNNWTPFYTSKSANMQVVSLVDGDSIPTTYDLNTSNKLASYLKPYIDGTGKVDVGPMSVLVMMELAETDSSNPDFDYQDFVLLLTFHHNHPNNGHGNNLDGVDSSNPGGGSGGPNGEVDPSGGVDDEIR